MSECECKTWCRDGLPPFTEHHRNCKNRNLEAESVALVSALVKGIENWAADSDGVHPDVWDAYQKALVFVGGFKKLAFDNHGEPKQTLAEVLSESDKK